MIRLPQLAPLTRTRWRRFRNNRRAGWSFMLLAALFALGLAAPLICRYGPRETMDPAAFEPYRRSRLTLVPLAAGGRFNLTADGRVTRAENCAAFFPGAADANREWFTNHWRIPPALDAALMARFANQAAPALETTLAGATNPQQQAACVLAAYEPREAPPASVRVALRATTPARIQTFDAAAPAPGQAVIRVEPATAWQQLPAEARAALETCLARAFAGGEAATEVTVAGVPLQARGTPAGVSWPHRPVPGHWMGVDASGYDVWTRMIYGLRTSLTFGLLLVTWAMLLGFVIGAVQGYFGGWIDILAQRLIEIWSALPFLYVMILVGAVLGRSLLLLLLCYALFNWVTLSYYMRAEFLRLRHRPFVEAARCQGLGHARIIFRHLLPNALTPIITLFPFELVGAIGALTALDFLGFGLPPLTPSWGELLQQAQQNRSAWWLALFPSAALFLVMLLAVLIGEGLRDAFDPRQRTKLEG
ncbi:MAG: ABC transporter permease subunit [bacterium]